MTDLVKTAQQAVREASNAARQEYGVAQKSGDDHEAHLGDIWQDLAIAAHNIDQASNTLRYIQIEYI